MSFSRRTLVKGSVGAVAALTLSGPHIQRHARAQSMSYEVVDLVTFDTMMVAISEYTGVLSDLTNEGTVCGAVVVSDKYSPSVWSPDGKLKRYKTGPWGGIIFAINDDGVAVGTVFNAGAFGKPTPALWRNGKEQEVQRPSDLEGEVVAGRINNINEVGVAIGTLDVSFDGETLKHPIIWQSDGSAAQLPPLDSEGDVVPVAINASGIVAGRGNGYTGTGSGPVLVIWDDSVATEVLPLEEFSDSEWELSVVGISDSNLVLGWHGRWGSQTMAVIYDRGKPSTLPLLEKDHVHTVATSISDNGKILGYSGDWATEMIPTIWIDGSPQDLTQLIPDMRGFEFRVLGSINNDGVITAMTTDGLDGFFHGLVLRPA